jgi:5-aminopentanamidase
MLVFGVIERAGGRYYNTAVVNVCYDTQHPQAAAAVAAAGAQGLLVPAQNMMRREKAFWWQDRHNEIRACRARETGSARLR